LCLPALTSLALNLPMPFQTKTDFSTFKSAFPYPDIHLYQTHPQVVINAFISVILKTFGRLIIKGAALYVGCGNGFQLKRELSISIF
jgi:hypothetical protein